MNDGDKRMTTLRHYDNLGTARFVTFSCYDRRPKLAEPGAREILVEEIDRARAKYGFQIWAYVLMPEHVHLVRFPPDGMKPGLVIREIKSRSAKRCFAEFPTAELWGTSAAPPARARVFWLRRCYDHNSRTLESAMEKVHYCHYNPVKRGLVPDPGEWIWSSYNWYQGRRDVPLSIEAIDL